VIEKY
jgi:acyl-CoA oxidase